MASTLQITVQDAMLGVPMHAVHTYCKFLVLLEVPQRYVQALGEHQHAGRTLGIFLGHF